MEGTPVAVFKIQSDVCHLLFGIDIISVHANLDLYSVFGATILRCLCVLLFRAKLFS